jgi:hypothetical protein
MKNTFKVTGGKIKENKKKENENKEDRMKDYQIKEEMKRKNKYTITAVTRLHFS